MLKKNGHVFLFFLFNNIHQYIDKQLTAINFWTHTLRPKFIAEYYRVSAKNDPLLV